MLNTDELTKLIKKQGLLPATERTTSFFSLSCIALGYTQILEKKIGMNFKALGALGNKNGYHTLLNEQYFAQEIEQFLKTNADKIKEKLFKPTHELFVAAQQKIIKLKAFITKEPRLFLRGLVKAYPEYFAAIGVYNGIWRYVGNRYETPLLSREQIRYAGATRDKIAKQYPKIEKMLQDCVSALSKKERFDATAVCFMTLTELKAFLDNKLTEDALKEISKRKNKYFYLSVDSNEYVFTDEKTLRYIEDTFYRIDSNITELKGHIAYGGHVKGVVFNVQKNKSKPMPSGAILVTIMTHPDDVPLIAKCAAIVTNEGGTLCHAAIVARELKKPCITGTKIATKVLKNGDKVEVDAEKGVVRKI